jgi:hypothetical protein
MNKIIAHLSTTPKTVKELAADSGLSESRVRELLKAAQTDASIVSTDTKPAAFSIVPPKPAKTKAPKAAKAAKEIKAPAPVVARPEHGDCPMCNASADQQVPAGDEGTLLGDTVNKCTACGKGWNIHDKTEVALPEVKAKRTPLNPQGEIDKKVAVVTDAGGKVEYASRTWTITLGKKSVTLTSREFSQYKGAAILEAVA